MKDKILKGFIIGTFVALYALTSIVSTIHVIDFFELSNPRWMAITLAVGFEIGAAASLASLIIMDKMNRTLVWSLFITITAMQINGNLYYAFINIQDYQNWVELFNLVDREELEKKRLLSAVSGAILPLVALGFIKSLVDYIKPNKDDTAHFSDIDKDLDDTEFKEDTDNDTYSQQDDYFEDDDPLFKKDTEDTKENEEAIQQDIKETDQSSSALDGDHEDHELERVLNDMVPEIEAKNDDDQDRTSAEIEPWDGTLTDRLDDTEDQDDALNKALEQKAEQNKQQYLKDNKNAKS